MKEPTASSPVAPADGVEQWEATFAEGLVARAPELWIAGHVHVVRGLPDQLDPVPTGGLPFHQLIAPLAPHHAIEGVAGGAPYYDGVFQPGDVLVGSLDIVLADTRTAWRALTPEVPGFGIFSVLLTPGQMAEACRAAGLDYAQVEWCDRLPAQDDPLLDRLVRTLGHEAEAGGPGGRVYAEALVQATAAHLLRHHSVQEGRPGRFTGGLTKRQLRAVEDYARAHLDADVSLADLAEQAGLSQYHFCREFGRSTGETPARFLTRLRMEKAARLLRRTEHTALAVALDVGYSSAGAFSTAFKRHHGVTPSAYRTMTEA